MANSPVLFGPNNTAINLQNQELLASGQLLQFNGPKNYIAYNNFENNATTGWGLGTVGTLTNGIPTGTPTFGSGASGNLSITTVSSGQLAGNYSLSLVSSAATTQGDMLASAALTIDAEDQSKVLTFKFYYSVPTSPTNGNFSGTSSNSFGVAVYDVTNTAFLPVAGNFSMTQNTGTGIASGTFQTNSSTASIRFIIYNVNASSGAITLYFDDFYLGPQTAPIGPVVTDWLAFTPTGSWVSNTTYTGMWRRVGDSVELMYNLATSGAPTAASLTVNLPSGMVIDTSKLVNATAATLPALGQGIAFNASSDYNLEAIYASTTSIQMAYQSNASGAMSTVNATSPFTFANTHKVSITTHRIPIVGWSSNVQMSSDTDTRVVAALISGNPASATSGNPIIVPTVGYDSHGCYNAATGRYTVPVSGLYKLFGALQSASSATTLTIYNNAVSTSLAGNLDSNGEATYCSSVNCIAGDIIDIRPGGTVDATSMTLNIERLCGPSVVAATESVNGRYYASATAITGSLATIVWTTKDFDSHNAMSSGLVTIPVSGKYQFNMNIQITGTIALNSTLDAQLQKNSVAVSEFQTYAGGAVTAQNAQLTDTISCLAGDVIRLQVSSGATLPVIASSNTKVFFSWERVGN